jgi:sugar/nucleoside kinase (ribokinase family)
VATQHVLAADTTGAGDAFDAGFLVGWFAARAAGRSTAASLQRAALAGHRAATRQLTTPRPELSLS